MQLQTRYGVLRQPNIYVVAIGLAALILVGLLAPSVPVTLIAAGLMFAGGLFAFAVLGATFGVANVTFSMVILVTVTLPDVISNTLGFSPVPAMIAVSGLLVILVIFGNAIPRVYLADIGVVIAIAGGIVPLIVSSRFSTIPGIAFSAIGVYAAARFARMRPEVVTNLLLASGVIMSIVAVLQQLDPLSNLVPFQPMRDDSVFYTSRSTGLYNNPNTLGNVLAITIVAGAAVGFTRFRAAAMPLCLLGIIASQSREALLGLALGLAVLYLRRPIHIVLAALAGMLAYVGSYAAVDGFADRFDPRTVLTDPNLLGRVEQWRTVADHIPESPLFGFGRNLPVSFVDNAYLGWLIGGGVVAAALSGIGLLAMFAGTRFWSVLVVGLTIALLSNPFAFTSATFSILLVLAGTISVGHEATGGRQEEKTQSRASSYSNARRSSNRQRHRRPDKGIPERGAVRSEA